MIRKPSDAARDGTNPSSDLHPSPPSEGDGVEELKPCPICGDAPKTGTHSGSDDTGERWAYHAVSCHKDDHTIICDRGETMAESIAAWNRRAIPSPSAWRTMESAPKDGTSIIGYQATEGDFHKCMGVVWSWEAKDYWHCADYPGLQPTHWQPLPSPPESADHPKGEG